MDPTLAPRTSERSIRDRAAQPEPSAEAKLAAAVAETGGLLGALDAPAPPRSRFNRYLTVIVLVYFGVASAFMLWHGQWLSPDQFLIVGFLLAVLLAKPLVFLKDWAPFVVLFLGYEYLRGLAPQLGMRVHLMPMIDADRWLFGGIPSVQLQQRFYDPTHLHVYDYLFTVVYMLHFILPFVFAFVIWMRDRSRYHRFVAALITLSFAGFFTYLLYPAAPPWMAAQKGLIPPVQDVFATTLGAFISPGGVPTVYGIMAPNPVAALPSLHAAYPFLVYLFLVRFYGWKGHLFLPYVLVVWISIVYTGQHYVVDALVGALYSLVTFAVTEYCWHRFFRHDRAEPAVTSPL
jgi:membrane-associated phospholipid phosphatase